MSGAAAVKGAGRAASLRSRSVTEGADRMEARASGAAAVKGAGRAPIAIKGADRMEARA